jgi:hypothetical protein
MARASTQYISTRTFNNAFYSYDVYSGLTLNDNADSDNCPPGRILKETGRKLYPGIHPTIKTIMTGVYDSVTLINGFIDANAGVFALYNTHRAPELTDGLDFNPRGEAKQEGVAHKGQSVYTLGDVVAGGQFYSIKTKDLTNSTSAVINADFSDTSYYTITINQDTELNALVVPPNKGTALYLTVYGDGLSKLTLSYNFTGDIKEFIPILGSTITIGFLSTGITMEILQQSSKGSTVYPIYQIVRF